MQRFNCMFAFPAVFFCACKQASQKRGIPTERTACIDSVFDEDIKQRCMNDHSRPYHSPVRAWCSESLSLPLVWVSTHPRQLLRTWLPVRGGAIKVQHGAAKSLQKLSEKHDFVRFSPSLTVWFKYHSQPQGRGLFVTMSGGCSHRQQIKFIFLLDNEVTGAKEQDQ